MYAERRTTDCDPSNLVNYFEKIIQKCWDREVIFKRKDILPVINNFNDDTYSDYYFE